MHVSHGTKEVLGRVLLANEQASLAPGESCFAQIRLEEPLPVSNGDRFIVRTYSPVFVAGGGQVLLAHPRLRTNLHGDITVLQHLTSGERTQALVAILELRETPSTASELAHYIGMDAAVVQGMLVEAVKEGSAISLGGGDVFFTTPNSRSRALSIVEHHLSAFHQANPSKRGVPKEELRNQCFPRMDSVCFDLLLEYAASEGIASEANGLVGHVSAQGAAQQAEDEAVEVVAAALASAGLTPPEVKELAAQVNLDQQLVRRALARLRDEGRAWKLSTEVYYDTQVVQACKQRIAEHLKAGGDGTMSGLKEVMGQGISRKYAMPLLEAFDAEGFTAREGDVRVLR